MKIKKTSELLVSCKDINTGEEGYITLEQIGVRIFETIRGLESEKDNKEKVKYLGKAFDEKGHEKPIDVYEVDEGATLEDLQKAKETSQKDEKVKQNE